MLIDLRTFSFSITQNLLIEVIPFTPPKKRAEPGIRLKVGLLLTETEVITLKLESSNDINK
jgi:hypothetical protein